MSTFGEAITDRDVANDLQVTWAREHSVAFVSKSGGHSPWSSIQSPGVVIDLACFSAVTVDKASETATITGSVLSKEVIRTLAAADVFTAIGNGNSVGAIPYFVGGGNNPFLPLTGYASDNILAARIITASGELLESDASHHADLLWAIRGAGQFFGLIVSLTVRTYPLSTLGNPSRTIWSSAFIFPLERAEEIARTMKPLMDDATYNTFGLIMILAPPPAFKPVILVAGKLFGSPADAPKAYKPLYDLGPIMVKTDELQVENMNDNLDHICAKGGLKRYKLSGAHDFNVENFMKTVALWKELMADCPDAARSVFNFDWHSRPAKAPEVESAMSHHQIRNWQSILLWYEDPASTDRAIQTIEDAVAAMRAGKSEDQYVDFPNSVRDGPISWRYRGEGRVAKLKSLKQQWDPDGMFTRQFLYILADQGASMQVGTAGIS